MPGVVQHSLESLRKAAREVVELGLGGIMLFGVPEQRDAIGSGADDPDGILNVALRAVRDEVGDATVVMADLCLDEFTDHGHCGVLAADGSVDNDATLDRYASMALAQADAGAHVVGLSGMMDGQVGYVRAALDAAGGGRRPGAGVRGQVRVGLLRAVPRGRRVDADRRPDELPAGPGERHGGAARGAARPRRGRRPGDGEAGAAVPGRASRAVAEVSDVPVAAYQVSGEYAMVEAAAAAGMIDRERAILESLVVDQAGRGADRPDLLGRRGRAHPPLTPPAALLPQPALLPQSRINACAERF